MGKPERDQERGSLKRAKYGGLRGVEGRKPENTGKWRENRLG